MKIRFANWSIKKRKRKLDQVMNKLISIKKKEQQQQQQHHGSKFIFKQF